MKGIIVGVIGTAAISLAVVYLYDRFLRSYLIKKES